MIDTFRKMTFRGGIHPPEEKDKTKGLPIQNIPLPDKVVIPLSQHAGTICKPIVKVGDLVKRGQKIGEGEGLITSTVHSSISGKVGDILPHPHPLGSDILSIIIESDGKDEWTGDLKENEDYLSIEPEKIRGIIRDAGIVGLGGAQFPTYIKLSPAGNKKIDYVILNGAECEPYITSDHRLMLERTSEIIEGLKIIMHVLSARKGFIGIEKNKPDAIEKMRIAECGLRNGKKSEIEVVGLNVKYPQGAEKQLIKTILKKEIPPSVFPIEAGVVVNNVGTAYAVYNAVRYGIPLIERVVTVTGDCIKEPQNLLVRIGTSFEFLIQNCGGFSEDPEKVIMGGPMMGITQYTLKVPVIKGTSGILVFSKDSTVIEDEYQPCIRCGRCVYNCPMGLSPNLYGLQAERSMIDEAYNLDVMYCIECGACSYVCPSKRPLMQFIKYLKAEIRKKNKKIS